jgi:hypothetical protein
MFEDLENRNVFVRNDSNVDITEEIGGKKWYIPAKCPKGPVDFASYDRGRPEAATLIPMPAECAQILLRRKGIRNVAILWDTLTLENRNGSYVFTTHDKPVEVQYDGKKEVLVPGERRSFPFEAARHFANKTKINGVHVVKFCRSPHPDEFVCSREMNNSQFAKMGRHLGILRKSTVNYDDYTVMLNNALWLRSEMMTKEQAEAIMNGQEEQTTAA